METIGLSFNDMFRFQVKAIEEARKGKDEKEIELSIARYINQGCSEEEARFRVDLTVEIASFNSALLAVIDANNKRIISDLKNAGLLTL